MHSLRGIVCLAMKLAWSHDFNTIEFYSKVDNGIAPQEVIDYFGDLGQKCQIIIALTLYIFHMKLQSKIVDRDWLHNT